MYKGTYRGVPVAVKTLPTSATGQYEKKSLTSLLHEARLLAKVRHGNVVACYGGCITDDNIFIVEVRTARLGLKDGSRACMDVVG